MTCIERRESPEMYLKTIYLIYKEKHYCRHVDVAKRLGVTRASVSEAVSRLKKEGLLTSNEDGMILLTSMGQERAHMIYDKFCFWENVLESLGITPETAEKEACKFEHVLSDEAFLQIKLAVQAAGI